MHPITARKVTNGSIWIACGVLVVVIRALLVQGGSLLVWEVLGAAMIVYGSSRTVWALVKGVPDAGNILE